MAPDVALRAEPSAPRERALPKRHLFGPAADFLCMGGSPLVMLPLLLLLPARDYQPLVLTAVAYLSILTNYPHFACSYVIFYRGSARNAFTGQLGRAMQARYLLAGLVVPGALAAFFAGSILAGNASLLGHAWRLFLSYNPLWVLVVPALNSLQYLIVVGRFELNYERTRGTSGSARAGSILVHVFGPSLPARMAAFAAGGVAPGFVMFFVLPVLMDMLLPYDRQAFGSMLFMFVSSVFINVHHSFLDNVMWRWENPDTRRHLFG